MELDKAIKTLSAEGVESVDDFLERIENNLREGQLRLVFSLEESSFELRSIVDFLNRQMERSEVLIVEARQYQQGDVRVVAPTLFGYTEQARRVKRANEAFEIRWGTGKDIGSFNAVPIRICSRSLFSCQDCLRTT